MTAYLYRRGAQYWFRRRIKIRATSSYFLEIRLALGMSDRAQAKKHARRLASVLDDILDALDEMMDRASPITREELTIIVRDLIREEAFEREIRRANAGARSDNDAIRLSIWMMDSGPIGRLDCFSSSRLCRRTATRH